MDTRERLAEVTRLKNLIVAYGEKYSNKAVTKCVESGLFISHAEARLFVQGTLRNKNKNKEDQP